MKQIKRMYNRTNKHTHESNSQKYECYFPHLYLVIHANISFLVYTPDSFSL